jgi:uncharacterized protein DUF4242
MPRYLVERAFHEAWDVDGDLAELCRQIREGNRDEVTWLHSYVSENRKRLFCIYEAPSPEAIRKSAARNDLPVDSITSIRVLDPFHFER